MSSTYISVALRREVGERAKSCCEYCRMGQENTAIEFAIDHVISEKHGGETVSENLALSCYWCNSYKGSDISSVDWDEDKSIIPLYNPRQQVWSDHFELDGVVIKPLTANGRVTVYLLRLNAPERVSVRRLLARSGAYPCN